MKVLNDRTGVIALIVLGLGITLSASVVSAHEGHKMECKEASIKAMKADVQAMPDGAPKTTASKELQAAQDMMQKNDVKACTAHMQTAMDAMEK